MIVLHEEDIKSQGLDWLKSIQVIEDTVQCLIRNDFAQPIKPYLHYRNPKNRIIAMPAFVGGEVNMAGIKWIASFPENIQRGIARAHSVVILNDGDTGEPVAIITTALLSIVRTASVSGMMILRFNKLRKLRNIILGIIGFGPIGQYHLEMCQSILGDSIAKIFIFDIRPIEVTSIRSMNNVIVVSTWEEAYVKSDIVITCTTSEASYIDREPKAGSLHLNVSLRDYTTATHEWFKNAIVVDAWDEVCRKNTDIERMHIEKGLQKEDTHSILDVVESNCLDCFSLGSPIFFNPMGMAVFDIAIGHFYYRNSEILKPL